MTAAESTSTGRGSTYCHAVEKQLPVHFKLIGRHHPSTRIKNDVIKLTESRERERRRVLRFSGS